jgi:hypothetical protein
MITWERREENYTRRKAGGGGFSFLFFLPLEIYMRQVGACYKTIEASDKCGLCERIGFRPELSMFLQTFFQS